MEKLRFNKQVTPKSIKVGGRKKKTKVKYLHDLWNVYLLKRHGKPGKLQR